MNGWFFQTIMTIITIYSLFSDDVRQLAFTSAADNTFYGLTSFALGMFGVELIMACFCKDDYFLGFYFWLDLISTASLITDIGWIMT
jgi:hypothetical protein